MRDAVARSKQRPGAEKEEMIDSSLYSARPPPGTTFPASLITSAISPLAFSPQPHLNAGGYRGYQDPPLAQPMPPLSNHLSTSYPMPLTPGQASTPQYTPAISSGYPTTATVAAHGNAAVSAMQPVSYSVPSSSSSPAGSGNSSPIYRNSIVLPQSDTKVAASAPAVSRPESYHSSSNSPAQANRYSQVPVSTNYGYPQNQTPAPQQQQPAASSSPTTPNSGFAQQYSPVPRYSTPTQQQPVMSPASVPYSTASNSASTQQFTPTPQQQSVVSPVSTPYPTSSDPSSTRQYISTPQQQPGVSPASALYPTASDTSSKRQYTPTQQQPVASPASTPYPTASDSSSTRQYTPTPQQQPVVSPASAPYPTASDSSSTQQYTPTPQQQPVANPASAPYPTASSSSSVRPYTPTPQQQPVVSPTSAPYPTASYSDSARQHDSALRASSFQPTATPAASPAFMASTPPSPSSAVASVAAAAATHRPPSNPTTTSVATAAATHRPPSNPKTASVAAAAVTYSSQSNHTTTSMAAATHRPPSNPTAAYPQPQSPPSAQHPEFGKGAPMSNHALVPAAAQQQQPYSRNSRPQAHADVVQADRQIYAPALSAAAQTITAVRNPASGLSNKPAPTPQIPQAPQTPHSQSLQNSQNSQNSQSSKYSQNSQFPNTLQTQDVDALYDELINSVTPASKITKMPGPSTAPAPSSISAPSVAPAPSTAAAILHSNAVTRVAKAPPRTAAQSKVRPTFQTLPQDVFVRIIQYLDVRILFGLYRTSKTIHAMLRENPECWQYITFAPSYHERVDHKFVEAMVTWLTRERLIHYVHSVVYDSTKVQEITVVQTLERFPALEHLSIERCWDVYSYPLANLLTVRSSHRSMHLAMLKSFRIGNSLYRGTIPQGFAVIAESKSFGQDVGLIDQAITQLAGHEVQFDVYLCENCDTGPCHPIFKCTFCGDVPIKKCWLCTPKCDRCGTRACGEESCKRDWRLSTEHRCGKCGVAVRLCTNRGCVNTPTCNQCGRYFHTRCTFEISNTCGLCEKTVCPFCDLDICTECKGQWCRKNRCSEVVSCECGKDKVVCPKDIKRCRTESCRKMSFCSKCLEQHKQKTGHDA